MLAFDNGIRVTVPPSSRTALSRVWVPVYAGLIDARAYVKKGEAESNVAPKKSDVGCHETSAPALVMGV